jgi:serine/threonine protein kinase
MTEKGYGLHDFSRILAPPQKPDEIGRLGGFRVLKVIGAGSQGVVFKADYPQLKGAVALKVPLPSLVADETARTRFLREARATAAVAHPHVVLVYEVGEDCGLVYMALELLVGESLEERLKRDGRLPAREVLRIGREIAEGLTAIHAQGLIHRHITPGNIFLEGKKGFVRIIDFGFARAISPDISQSPSGVIFGASPYMSPEQARGDPLNERTDLFSLGAVLYHACAGQAPFKGNDVASLAWAVENEQPRSPFEVNPEVPRAVSDLVMHLLAKDRAERPVKAQDVVGMMKAKKGWITRIWSILGKA